MTATNVHLIDYTCNICEKEVEYRSYIYHDDIPDGWITYSEHGDYYNTEFHACDTCAYMIKDGYRIS